MSGSPKYNAVRSGDERRQRAERERKERERRRREEERKRRAAALRAAGKAAAKRAADIAQRARALHAAAAETGLYERVGSLISQLDRAGQATERVADEAAVHRVRSEERRVGKECRARGSLYHQKD